MALTNPLLDEISNLSPGAQAALVAAHGAASQPAAAAPPPPAGMTAPGAAAPPMMGAPPAKNELGDPMGRTNELGALLPPKEDNPGLPPAAPRGTLLGDQNERSRLLSTGSGISQIGAKVAGAMPNHPTAGKLLGGATQTVATLGDALLAPAIPGVLNKLPGTEEHHNVLVKRANADVNQDEADAEKEAQTKNLELQPQLKLAQQALNQEKQDEIEHNNQGKLQSTLAAHGYAPDEQNPGQIRPLRYEEMSPTQQAVSDLKGAQEEQAQATAALRKAQNDPSSPAFRIAQERVNVARQNASTAVQRLGLSEQEFGFNQDKFYNPQPTAAERGKGDLAQSAVERIAEMRKIVAKRPDIFGPVAGRATNASQWLGSQDPDAQTYLSASQYLADHSAGVFGGRGQYILSQLHGITDPHSNPEALNAALDEAEKAATGFVKAGAVHGKGGSSGYAGGDAGGAPGAPKVGDIRPGDGGNYRFKGGDQYDQKNWEKVAK